MLQLPALERSGETRADGHLIRLFRIAGIYIKAEWVRHQTSLGDNQPEELPSKRLRFKKLLQGDPYLSWSRPDDAGESYVSLNINQLLSDYEFNMWNVLGRDYEALTGRTVEAVAPAGKEDGQLVVGGRLWEEPRVKGVQAEVGRAVPPGQLLHETVSPSGGATPAVAEAVVQCATTGVVAVDATSGGSAANEEHLVFSSSNEVLGSFAAGPWYQLLLGADSRPSYVPYQGGAQPQPLQPHTSSSDQEQGQGDQQEHRLLLSSTGQPAAISQLEVGEATSGAVHQDLKDEAVVTLAAAMPDR